MKVGDRWISEATDKGFRVSAELPGALTVSLERRMILAEVKDAKVTGHSTLWRLVCQIAVFFPVARAEADAMLGHLFDHYDPDLRKHLGDITGWMDALPEGAPPPPGAQGTLN